MQIALDGFPELSHFITLAQPREDFAFHSQSWIPGSKTYSFCFGRVLESDTTRSGTFQPQSDLDHLVFLSPRINSNFEE